MKPFSHSLLSPLCENENPISAAVSIAPLSVRPRVNSSGTALVLGKITSSVFNYGQRKGGDGANSRRTLEDLARSIQRKSLAEIEYTSYTRCRRNVMEHSAFTF